MFLRDQNVLELKNKTPFVIELHFGVSINVRKLWRPSLICQVLKSLQAERWAHASYFVWDALIFKFVSFPKDKVYTHHFAILWERNSDPLVWTSHGCPNVECHVIPEIKPRNDKAAVSLPAVLETRLPVSTLWVEWNLRDLKQCQVNEKL